MSDLLVERRGRVLHVTLNRPESLNACTVDLTRELREAVERASTDSETRVVVLTGAGRWNTRDSREGIAAFLEKREAKFERR